MARTPSSHDWHVQPVVKDRIAFRLSGALSVPTGCEQPAVLETLCSSAACSTFSRSTTRSRALPGRTSLRAQNAGSGSSSKKILGGLSTLRGACFLGNVPEFQPRGRGNFSTRLLYQMFPESAKTQNPSRLMPRLNCRLLLYQPSWLCAST